MPNSYFQFKQFLINQDRAAMKVTTDACLFGAWVAWQEKKEKTEKSLLDIGTGTGLLSLMIAQETECKIDALELEENAYKQAVENVNASQWSDRITVINDDVLSSQQLRNRYDVIVSNPPFYENNLRSLNENKNKAHHDESLRLTDLLSFIATHLDNFGHFYLLLPFSRNEEIEVLLGNYQLFAEEWINVRPTANNPFFRCMIKGSKKDQQVVKKEMLIRESPTEYSATFIELLKGYYLYL